MIRALCNGKDMWWDFIPPLTTVNTYSSHSVNRESFVGVDSDTEETGVGVDELFNVPLLQIEEDGGVIQIGEVRHVLTAVVLGRVHLAATKTF